MYKYTRKKVFLFLYCFAYNSARRSTGHKKGINLKMKSLIKACAFACAFAAPAMAEGGMFEGALPENWTADVVAAVRYKEQLDLKAFAVLFSPVLYLFIR